MPDPSEKQKHVARHFLRLALEDMESAERQPRDLPGRHRNVCFFSQQAAEKAIMAALSSEGVTSPYSHNLSDLLYLLPEVWEVRRNPPEGLAQLTEWAVGGRYPGYLDSPDNMSAKSSLATARQVVDSVKADCASIGVAVDVEHIRSASSKHTP